MGSYFGNYFGDYFGDYFGLVAGSGYPPASLDSLYDMYKHTWQSFPDVSQVQYHDTRGSVAGARARKCLPRQSELVRIESFDTQVEYATFIVWDATLRGTSLQGNGKLTWRDGSIWTIQALWKDHFETQWRCLCRRDL